MTPAEVDERLARLARATEGVKPRVELADLVMAAVMAEQNAIGWWSHLPRASRGVLPALTLVAVLAVLWAFRSSHDVDDAVVGSFDSVEIEW